MPIAQALAAQASTITRGVAGSHDLLPFPHVVFDPSAAAHPEAEAWLFNLATVLNYWYSAARPSRSTLCASTQALSEAQVAAASA